MRVAVTLEQCWHRVPGGTARATLDTVDAVAARGDVEQVGRERPAPRAGARRRGDPASRSRRCRCPRLALYESWQRLRRPARRAGDRRRSTSSTPPPTSPPRRAAPMVATVHDLHFLHEPSHFTRRGVGVFTRFLDLVRDEAAVVVCPSEATRADCEAAGIDRARLRVTPWATHAVPVAPSEAARVREAYGLHRPFVLFAGTVEPRKNLGRLVEAFGRARRGRRRAGDRRARTGGARTLAALAGPRVRRLGFVPAADRDALYAGRRPSSPTRACGRASACRCSRRWCRARRS